MGSSGFTPSTEPMALSNDANAPLAVLIDADNAHPSIVEGLLAEVATLGVASVKRIYGDWTTPNLSQWKQVLLEHSIQPIQQFRYTTGKNATDSAMIIDAMDLLYAGNVEAFAIVSSDSDFTSLALRLRESGKVVYGLGRQKTPVSLQNACDRFIQLEVLGTDASRDEEPDDDADDSGATEPAPQLNLQSVLTKAVNATAEDDGWAALSAIGSHLARSHPSFDPRTYGHGKLSSLVADQPWLQTRPDGPRLEVALKGTTKKTPARKKPVKKAAAKKG